MERYVERSSGRSASAARIAWVVASVLATICALSQRMQAQGTNPGIAGTVRYYSNDDAVSDVAVQLSGTLTGATTDAGGAYALADPGQSNCTVEPAKVGDLNGAVSSLDASWVQQAVVGLRQFTANQILACDVTGDGTVSSLDAARILQFIAGLRNRLPVAQACDSDWAFVPVPAGAPNQHIVSPQVAPMCAPGGIAFEPLVSPVDGQDFLAIVFGDCTGNWHPAPPSGTPTPPAAATPTDTAVPVPTATASATAKATLTAPPPATASATATLTRSGTPTRTATVTTTPTPGPSLTRTRTPSGTATPTRSATPSVTATLTASVTSTRTVSSTPTPSRTITATRTNTLTPTATTTFTGTPTRTGTRTATPTSSLTPSPTPTATCANGLAWNLSPATLISAQSGGNLWLAKTVPTDFGWGIFWLRQDPGASSSARLYYAHIDFSGQITAGPLLVVSIPKIPFRGHYYFAAWNQDHYGLLISSQATLYYYSMSLAGVLSSSKVVGPTLFVSSEFDEESDGDLDALPTGFLGVIEGDCDGHSCSYAFKLDRDGTPIGSPINLVDFDFTHQFYPRSAFDGAGSAILSVKDIDISGGGVTTKYLPSSNVLSSNAKVVPAKEYLWDEFPDIAWNGDHFAAVWTENSARRDTAPWQIHFASFRRTKLASTLIADRVIDMVAQKTNQRWTTQVHAVGVDWVAQYATRAADNSISAVYELLGDDALTRAALEPFTLSADALGSSPHFVAGHAGTVGIARGSNLAQSTEVAFYTLPPPACAP